MSDGEDESEDKQYEPTPKKLDDKRRKGEVARSADLTTAASYGGFLLVALTAGGGSLVAMGANLMTLLDRADSLSETVFGGASTALAGRLVLAVAGAMAPWFLVPALAALLSTLAQRSLVFAPTKLAPKASRLSPLSNAKNKFGRSGLFEFSKSAAKLFIYGTVLATYLAGQMPEILATVHLSPAMATAQLASLAARFVIIVVLIAAAIGGVDFLWQAQEHIRKNRMTHKEMKDETKQSEGDPHVKQQRRQKGQDIAMNQMLADVPGADVVVVNPRHFAVALKWDRTSPGAPVCVAKGVDEIAARIREAAGGAGVPIHRDPPTARALHAAIEIGQEVPPDHYRTVAAAIRFAERMRQRAKARGW